MKVRKFGGVIGLRDDMAVRYRELHANVWPGVLNRLRKSHISNFSIYVTELDGKQYLFSYYEYEGDDYEADMQAISDDSETQRWWKETDPCQFKLPNRGDSHNWTQMERVFFMDR